MLKVKLPANYDKLTRAERREVREAYKTRQKTRCWFCNELLTDQPVKYVCDANIDLSLFPRGFLLNPEHLHHDHDTGLTLGTVHARCNAYLWQYLGE